MKPILVHVHIYYTEMWDELKSYVSNIFQPYDLYVTLNTENTDLYQDIISFKPDAHVEILANKGFDVGPFIHVLNQVDLDDYSYIIKLHTKRDLPPFTYLKTLNVSGGLWRKYSLSFLKKQNFAKCIAAFEANLQLGMVGNYFLIFKKEFFDVNTVKEGKQLLEQAVLPIVPLTYIAGTMFMCRAELLKVIQQLDLTLDDFNNSDRSQKTSLAHTLERFLGWIIIAQGFTVADPFTSELVRLQAFVVHVLKRLRFFLFRVKVKKGGHFSEPNKMRIKIFNITVLSLRIRSRKNLCD